MTKFYSGSKRRFFVSILFSMFSLSLSGMNDNFVYFTCDDKRLTDNLSVLEKLNEKSDELAPCFSSLGKKIDIKELFDHLKDVAQEEKIEGLSWCICPSTSALSRFLFIFKLLNIVIEIAPEQSSLIIINDLGEEDCLQSYFAIKALLFVGYKNIRLNLINIPSSRLEKKAELLKQKIVNQYDQQELMVDIQHYDGIEKFIERNQTVVENSYNISYIVDPPSGFNTDEIRLTIKENNNVLLTVYWVLGNTPRVEYKFKRDVGSRLWPIIKSEIEKRGYSCKSDLIKAFQEIFDDLVAKHNLKGFELQHQRNTNMFDDFEKLVSFTGSRASCVLTANKIRFLYFDDNKNLIYPQNL